MHRRRFLIVCEVFRLACTFLQCLKAFLTPLEPEFEDRELNKQFRYDNNLTTYKNSA